MPFIIALWALQNFLTETSLYMCVLSDYCSSVVATYRFKPTRHILTRDCIIDMAASLTGVLNSRLSFTFIQILRLIMSLYLPMQISGEFGLKSRWLTRVSSNNKSLSRSSNLSSHKSKLLHLTHLLSWSQLI